MCSGSNGTPRYLEIAQCHQAAPSLGTRQMHNTRAAPSSSQLDLLHTHPCTSAYIILSGNQGTNTQPLVFITAVPSGSVQTDQAISGNSKVRIHLLAAVFQNSLSGKDVSRKHTQTLTDTLPVAQAELCTTLSRCSVYFSGTMCKYFQQNSLHLDLFTR